MSGDTIRKVVYDPLTELMSYYAGKTSEVRETVSPTGPIEERSSTATASV